MQQIYLWFPKFEPRCPRQLSTGTAARWGWVAGGVCLRIVIKWQLHPGIYIFCSAIFCNLIFRSSNRHDPAASCLSIFTKKDPMLFWCGRLQGISAERSKISQLVCPRLSRNLILRLPPPGHFYQKAIKGKHFIRNSETQNFPWTWEGTWGPWPTKASWTE